MSVEQQGEFEEKECWLLRVLEAKVASKAE